MVFRKQKENGRKDTNVSVLLGKKMKKGDVGLEIEVEGRRLPADAPKPWTYHRDGSLRGAENAEYTLSGPISFDRVNPVLDSLWAKFKENKATLDASNRTSVHVHINVLPLYLNRLTNFMSLWFICEDILTHWCGEYRVGNLFCLRAKDATSIIRSLRRFIESNGRLAIGENNHYAALNGHAIHKFGSLEFRSLRGTDDVEVIKTWVGILRRLYDKSAEWEDPRILVESFSLEGPLQFFYNTLGEYSEVVRKGVPLTDDQFRDSLYEGVRFAQDLCYARDWSNFNPVEVSLDPFGRKKKAEGERIDDGPRLEVEDDGLDEEWRVDDDMEPVPEPREVPRAQPRFEEAVTIRNDPFAPFRIRMERG